MVESHGDNPPSVSSMSVLGNVTCKHILCHISHAIDLCVRMRCMHKLPGVASPLSKQLLISLFTGAGVAKCHHCAAVLWQQDQPLTTSLHAVSKAGL